MNPNDRIELIRAAVNKVQNNDSDDELDFNDREHLKELERIEQEYIGYD